MANLHRNEAAKLTANLLNTCAGSILTVGVFTPFVVIAYGAPEVRSGFSLSHLAVLCLLVSAVLHAIGQMVLWLMEDAVS